MTGTAQSVIAHIASRAMRAGSVTSVGGISRLRSPSLATDRLQVDAGHERPVAGGSEHGHPDVAVVVEPVEHLDDLRERPGVDRVDRRPVEGDDGDVVGDVDVQIVHGPILRGSPFAPAARPTRAGADRPNAHDGVRRPGGTIRSARSRESSGRTGRSGRMRPPCTITVGTSRSASSTRARTSWPTRSRAAASAKATGSRSSTRTAPSTSRRRSRLAKLNAVNVAVNWRLAPTEIARDHQRRRPRRSLIVGPGVRAAHREDRGRRSRRCATIVAIGGHPGWTRLRVVRSAPATPTTRARKARVATSRSSSTRRARPGCPRA